MGPQHGGQRVGMASPSGLGVEGADAVLQTLPGNQAVHPLQEQLPAGLTPFTLVFQVGKGGLIHLPSLLNGHRLVHSNYATS